MWIKKKLANWGNFPAREVYLNAPSFAEEMRQVVLSEPTITARGKGRCYGDSALGDSVVSTLRMNRLTAFDSNTGILTCESGATLDEILLFSVPRGYFLPVTPGTKFITVGGAIASDIHGKNHHVEGCFSEHVLSLTLMNAAGELLTCGPNEQPEVFWDTVGGMGKSGVILRATFQLKPIESAYIKQRAIKARNLDEVMDLFAEHESYTYSVAWLDCLARGKHQGKSILMLGEHAKLAELSSKQRKKPLQTHKEPGLSIPFYFPQFVLNKWSIKAFNFAFYHKQGREVNNYVHYEPFFYPLDKIKHWNRMYGKQGFTQYQFVLPTESSKAGLSLILDKIAASGEGSFLVVLKQFGNGRAEAIHSFPMKGYTLALDFKATPKVFRLLDELDRIVADMGGRLYLTKDARMSSSFFKQSYPNFTLDNARFTSDQLNRLCVG